MEHIKTYEIFSELGSLLGKGAGKLNSMLPKINIQSRGEVEDADLGREILEYLENMSRSYNRSGNFDPNTVMKVNNNWYSFTGKIFKNSQDNYKIEVIKHMDYKTKNVPEYTVTINKVTTKQGRQLKSVDKRGGYH